MGKLSVRPSTRFIHKYSVISETSSWKYYSIFFFLLFTGWVSSCTTRQQPSETPLLFFENIDSLIQANPDSALKTLSIIKKLSNLSDAQGVLDKRVLSLKLDAFQQKGMADSMALVINELAPLHMERGDTAQLIDILRKVNYTDLTYSYLLSLTKWLKVTSNYIWHNDLQTENALVIHNLLAQNLIEANDFRGAEEVLERAIRNTDVTQNTRGHAALYVSFGELYFKQELLEQAKKNYKIAADLTRDREGLLNLYTRSLNNLGITYSELNQLDSAAYCYQWILDNIPEDDVVPKLINTLNLGNIYWQERDKEKAVATYQQVVRESQENGIDLGVIYGNINLANVQIESGKPQLGIKMLEDMVDQVLSLGGPELLHQVQMVLEKGYKKAGEYQAAYEMSSQINLYNDSIQTASNKSNIANLELIFNTERLSLQNQVLSAQNKQWRFGMLILLGFSVGLFVILGLIYRNYQIQRRLTERYKKVLVEKDAALEARDEAIVEKEALYKRLLQQERNRSEHLEEKIEVFKAELQGKGVNFSLEDSQQFWISFALKFKLLFPNFEQEMLQKYPMLSPSDLQFCKLVKLNLPTQDMAYLLNVAPRSLYRKKQRIFEKMGVNGSTDRNLMDYLPE